MSAAEMRHLLLSLALLAGSTAASHATVIVAGNVTTPGAPCTLTLTQDMTYQLTAPNFKLGYTDISLVMQGWAATASTATTSLLLNQPLNVSVDGFAGQYQGYLTEGWIYAYGDISTRDAYLDIVLPLYPAGTTITFNAGTYTFAGSSSYSPNLAGIFDGTSFLSDSHATRISNVIPEPATGMLGLLGAVGLFRRRRAC